MNAIAPFKCLLACVTATTMCAMMTACSPSRTPSSDASSTAKRPASTVEVRRGGITPLSSSSTGVQVAPVFSLTTRRKAGSTPRLIKEHTCMRATCWVPSAIRRRYPTRRPHARMLLDQSWSGTSLSPES